jgi:capsular polysaccharide biosynthesis protein
MKYNLKSLRGHIIGILFITLITTTVAAIQGLNQAEFKYETTVFLSIGHKYNAADGISAYETVHAADSFKETVQGWFRNPSFLERIFDEADASADLSARNQEKQNILITYNTKDKNTAEKIADSIKDNLVNEISAYNIPTRSEFTLALYDYNIADSPDRLVFFVLFGIFAGLFLGLFVSFTYEALFTSSSKHSLLQKLRR